MAPDMSYVIAIFFFFTRFRLKKVENVEVKKVEVKRNHENDLHLIFICGIRNVSDYKSFSMYDLENLTHWKKKTKILIRIKMFGF
jgi:hypothetical protein